MAVIQNKRITVS